MVTWEDYDEMQKKFSNFTLEDKCILEGVGNGKNPIRRSARIKAQVRIMAQYDDEACKNQEDQLGMILEQLGEVSCIKKLWTVAYGGSKIDWEHKRKETSAIGRPIH